MPSASPIADERGELRRQLVRRDDGIGVRRALALEVGGGGPARPAARAARPAGLLRLVAGAVEGLGRLRGGDLRWPRAAAGPAASCARTDVDVGGLAASTADSASSDVVPRTGPSAAVGIRGARRPERPRLAAHDSATPATKLRARTASTPRTALDRAPSPSRSRCAPPVTHSHMCHLRRTNSNRKRDPSHRDNP